MSDILVPSLRPWKCRTTGGERDETMQGLPFIPTALYNPQSRCDAFLDLPFDCVRRDMFKFYYTIMINIIAEENIDNNNKKTNKRIVESNQPVCLFLLATCEYLERKEGLVLCDWRDVNGLPYF